MIDGIFTPSGPHDDEETVRPGPLWRHTSWVIGITLFGVGAGWAISQFRIGSGEYGLPAAAPGPVWPYLIFWTMTSLAAAAALRAVAARVPVYAPGEITAALTALGTRLSLGWRPEPPLLGAMAVALLTAVAMWCALALRSASRGGRGG
ncbi:hypothetical protein [Streptomyces sp. NPDC098781]|uniref:hypothetical protein n=1 Tax=Streptomyces sp. NPDC098781 TaxID=3366097 RepID=UPI00382A2961